MTREEQIQIAAEGKYIPDVSTTRYIGMTYDAMMYSHNRSAFIEGAKWADANRWVRVEDGLPELNVEVIVYSPKYKGFRIDVVKDFDGGVQFFYGHITHWQYITLPEPPKLPPQQIDPTT